VVIENNVGDVQIIYTETGNTFSTILVTVGIMVVFFAIITGLYMALCSKKNEPLPEELDEQSPGIPGRAA